MKVGICAVGSPALAGDMATLRLARRLVEAGLDVAWHVSVGYDRDRVAVTLDWLIDHCHAVVISGGLGPAQGDLIPRVLAELASVPLERRHDRTAASTGPRSSDEVRQADLPAGSVAFEPFGTAPGFTLEVARPTGGSAVVYALPATAFELRAMTERDVLPDLTRRRATSATVAPRGEASEERAEQSVAQLLRSSRATVATAESCTAGAVMTRLAAEPGASAYLRGGLVAYATDVKSSVLGLEREFVDEHGPVSIETTEAMARRARDLFDADFGLGVTCVAGPDAQGGRSVGTTIWALASRKGNDGSGELEIVGDRPFIQRRAAMVVVEVFLHHLRATMPPREGGG